MDGRLRILFVSHFFPPEVNCVAVRVSELAKQMAKLGADPTVLTCFPKHEDGTTPKEYRGHFSAGEKLEAIRVVRTFGHAAANRGFVKQVFNLLSFMLSAIVFGAPSVGRQDIVIASPPHLFTGIAGYVISRLRRCKFVLEVGDFWPGDILVPGAIKNWPVATILNWIERFLCRRADIVVAMTEGTIENLEQRGVQVSKIAHVPDGVDIDLFRGQNAGGHIRHELGLEGQYVVGYIGTHGAAHNLDSVLEAARLLRFQDDIRFLFVGDGPEKQNLVKSANTWALKNVIFHGQVPRALIPEYYDVCDLCLVTSKKPERSSRKIPSKIYEIMASATPMIITTEGESRRMVELSGAGLGSRPEDPEGLTEKILFLKDNPDLCREMGQAGYTFVVANSSLKRMARHYVGLLTELAKHEQKRAYQIQAKAEDIYSVENKERAAHKESTGR